MALPVWIDQVSEDARCALLDGGTAVAAYAAAQSLLSGAIWPGLGAAAGTAAFAALSRFTGCNYNPGSPNLPSNGGAIWNIQCNEVDGCADFKMRDTNGTIYTIARDVQSFSGAGRDEDGWPIFNINLCDGSSTTSTGGEPGFITSYYLEPQEGSECVSTGGPEGPGTETEPDKDPLGEPYNYTDEGGCVWTVTANNTYIGQDGLPRLKFKAESNDPENCGGPYEWWQNPTGPVEPIGPNPNPDGDGTDLAPELDQIRREIENLKKLIKEYLPPEPELGGTTYELKGICEYNEDCKPIERKTTVNIPAGKASQGLASRLDALETLLQAHKNYGQPGCNCKPCLDGEWRTINFISDEKSANGNRRLTKRLRYRSRSGTDLGGLIDHWKDFTWLSGDVVVQHKGGWWGTPQVWARSEGDGKFVLRHAAAEAGIDLDSVGEWVVTSHGGTRCGQLGTMRVNQTGGYYWITARNGENNRPEVGTT